MKRVVALVCALGLLVGLSACGRSSGKTYTVDSADVGKVIVYEEPEGYELYASNDVSAAFVKYDGDGNMTHAITIGYMESTEEERKAYPSGSISTLEEELMTTFEDNLKVNFVTMNEHPGIRIDDSLNSEITYILLVGEYSVMVLGEGAAANLDEIHEDMKVLIDSIGLQALTFG